MSWKDPQLFVTDCDNKPSPIHMLPISNYTRPWMKPQGGIWTSTYTGEETGSAWVQWAQVHLLKNEWHSYLLRPRRDAKVYVIDGRQDLERLLDRFEHPDSPRPTRMIDFEKMALHYDALHLTEKGEEETRWGAWGTLYNWDVESTLWFRWVFEEVENLGVQSYSLDHAAQSVP